MFFCITSGFYEWSGKNRRDRAETMVFRFYEISLCLYRDAVSRWARRAATLHLLPACLSVSGLALRAGTLTGCGGPDVELAAVGALRRGEGEHSVRYGERRAFEKWRRAAVDSCRGQFGGKRNYASHASVLVAYLYAGIGGHP